MPLLDDIIKAAQGIQSAADALTWKDILKPASFKGIPFYTESASFDFGRSIKIDRPGAKKEGGALGSFAGGPKKDDDAEEGVIITDLGPREYEIMVKAYFIGDDYFRYRTLFEEEFIKGGTQVLILPLEEPRSVRPVRARRKWSSKEGGIEYIEASFLISTEYPDDRLNIDTSKEVEERAKVVTETVTEDAVKNFTVEEAAPFVEESAVTLADKFAATLEKIKGYGAVTDDFEEWSEGINDFALGVADAIRVPERMFADAVELVEGVQRAFVTIESSVTSLVDFVQNFSFSALIPDFLSDDRLQQHQNNNSMTAVFRGSALSQITLLTAQQSFSSKEEAVDQMDNILVHIDETLNTAGEIAVLEFLHEPLSTLRAAFVKDMMSRAIDLPSILVLNPPQTRPILTLAYDIYGDLDKEEDLIARNIIRNPNASSRVMEVTSP